MLSHTVRAGSRRQSSASPAVAAPTTNSSVAIAGARASIGNRFRNPIGRDQRPQQHAGKQFLPADQWTPDAASSQSDRGL